MFTTKMNRWLLFNANKNILVPYSTGLTIKKVNIYQIWLMTRICKRLPYRPYENQLMVCNTGLMTKTGNFKGNFTCVFLFTNEYA